MQLFQGKIFDGNMVYGDLHEVFEQPDVFCFSGSVSQHIETK